MKKVTLLLASALVSSIAVAAVEPKDMEFMNEAAIAGLFEIKASELAKTRATTPEAKNFANKMIKDHTTAANELKALAVKKGVKLPENLDKEHGEQLAKLEGEKDGKAFNEQYADLMEDSHDDAVTLFETAAKSATDADVKAFAAKTLPILKMHSDHAETLDRKDIAP